MKVAEFAGPGMKDLITELKMRDLENGDGLIKEDLGPNRRAGKWKNKSFACIFQPCVRHIPGSVFSCSASLVAPSLCC